MIKLSASFGRLKLITIIPCKTHNFHWKVTGPMFQTLHLMFETYYNELALAFAVDLLAGRIYALGFPPAT